MTTTCGTPVLADACKLALNHDYTISRALEILIERGVAVSVNLQQNVPADATATDCPGCHQPAMWASDGTITCPDPYDGPHVMTVADIARIRQANELARAISTRRHDQSVENILRGWAA